VLERFERNEKAKKYRLNGDLTDNEYRALCDAVGEFVDKRFRESRSSK
jgi:hypothetical protein